MAIDTALAARERAGAPIRVALVGAGVSGRGIARRLLTPVPGMRLVAIANRTIERAISAFDECGVTGASRVSSSAALDDRIAAGLPSVVEDAQLVCAAGHVDVVVEATGTVEHGAHVAMAAIRHRKHVVLVNAELDATLGPILKVHADRAGVVLTDTDGDEPGIAMTLVRYLRSIGYRVVGAGNLKGVIDRYRTPDTQREFAAKYGLDPFKAASFADGTKLSMEATVLANATGFHVGQRGMYGPSCAHVQEIAGRLPAEELLGGGLVDYALGAAPHTGAYAIVCEPDARKRDELAYFKMGSGPFYVFHTPYHLPYAQVASTIARAALDGDATVAPAGAPVCDVITIAKRDLTIGECLDGLGGFAAYGTIENAGTAAAQGLLPMGLAEGCRLVANVKKDQAVRMADVAVPPGRLSDRLRAEQTELFEGAHAGAPVSAHSAV